MRVQFGDVRVDSGARQLWRGSDSVHLTRKAFELLLLLLEHRPSAVSKEQIHQRLWPETFVSESSLQALVSEIRQAIGDDGRRRALVRTVHGVGYAFSGEVTEEEPPAPRRREAVRAWLVGQLDRIALYEGDNILGRVADDGIEIDDSTVSRRHARITVTHDGAMVEDLGSKNGTWVRDARITTRVVLADGDTLGLGSARYTFRLPRSGEATEAISPADVKASNRSD